MKIYTALLLLILPFLSANSQIHTKRSLSQTPYGYKITEAPDKERSQAERFELRSGDCGKNETWNDCKTDRSRTEIKVDKIFNVGERIQVSLSFLFPKGFKSSSKIKTTFFQIHQIGGPEGKISGHISFPPLLQLFVKGDEVQGCLHLLKGEKENVLDECDLFKFGKLNKIEGKWNSLKVDFNSKAPESIRIGFNDEIIFRREKFIKFWPETFYIKYGLYNSFLSRHGKPMPTQVLYFKNLKLN